MDIAGDEGGFPLKAATDPMAAATVEAARLGIPLTLHAGTVPDGADTDSMAAATANAARLGIPLTLHAGTVPYLGQIPTL
jgi:hypothetical protein